MTDQEKIVKLELVITTLRDLENFKRDTERTYGRKGASTYGVPWDAINAEGARRAKDFRDAIGAIDWLPE